jgi:hypothetical protein
MGKKRHTAEQIIGKLRTAEIELAKGLGTVDALIREFKAWMRRNPERKRNSPTLHLSDEEKRLLRDLGYL